MGRPCSAVPLPLEGTCALVTGASRGIGAAIAVSLGRAGASLALLGQAPGLDTVAKRICGQGRAALVRAVDLTERSQLQAAAEDAIASLGRLDILVANAGMMRVDLAERADPGEWEQTIALNLLGAMHCARVCLPHLVKAAEVGPRGVADIVNIGSLSGRLPTPGRSAYAASKAGIEAFSNALRQEVAERFVRVSLIMPGLTATGLRADGGARSVTGFAPEPAGLASALAAEDVARAVEFVVTQPKGVAVSELVVRPTDQLM